jgi:hypothetical protein
MDQFDTDIYSGERLTFSDFFTKKKLQIEIPIIQRDFAQGRKSSSEIRDVFLDTLYNYLDENEPERDLDFIYGSVTTNENKEKRFIPLDGQQRLTTLFLLHWYLANISGNMPEFRGVLSANKKSKFTYETRTSSREFCDAIMLNDIDFDNLLPPDKDTFNSLSKTIQDSGWYYLSWENDPTIQSMLVMLDAMHNKFQHRPDFFERLWNTENPVITFLSLNLQEFKLTDDLYIKMNSRGKPLSPFENFKAKFEQHIGGLDWDKPSPFELEYDGEKKKVSRQDYFSHKIDTAWADLFWNYRKTDQEYSSFDTELMNFIRVIIATRCALEKVKNKDETLEFLLGTQAAKKRKGYTDDISFHRYHSFGVLRKKAIMFLIRAFDQLANGAGKIKERLKSKEYFSENEVFKKVLDHTINLEQRVQFYAYIGFLVKNKGNEDGFDQWMRVIHNLVLNTVIDSADDVASAIISVHGLLPYSSRVLHFLMSDQSDSIAFFYSRQIQEEQIKAHLINKGEKWQSAVEQAELHPYFSGQIMFMLEFSGVLNYFEERKDCNWTEVENEAFLNSFMNYLQKSDPVFRMVGTQKNKDFSWERAVLSKGDYLIHTSAFRRNFLSTNRSIRDYSWKRLLRLPPLNDTRGEDKKALEERRMFVKDVFDDPLFHVAEVSESLKSIRKVKPGGWRNYFIEKPALIDYCEQGFIRFESPSKILLFKHSQQNHTQAELYTYNLYLKEFLEKDIHHPFAFLDYYEVRSSDDLPCIIINDFTHRVNLGMYIVYDSEGKQFEVQFFKNKGNKKLEDYPDEIVSAAEESGFTWNEEYLIFTANGKRDSDTIAIVKDLCSRLKEL